MLVSELLTTIAAEEGYTTGSLILKSSNDAGCTYKWLTKRPDGKSSFRRELFIATSGTGDIETRTVVDSIEVIGAE